MNLIKKENSDILRIEIKAPGSTIVELWIDDVRSEKRHAKRHAKNYFKIKKFV